MCLSIPGKVASIRKGKITVDYSGEKREANLALMDIKVGDWVIVNNKIIISKMPKEEARKILEAVK